MKHLWTIICKNSSIDSDTNLISLFDVLETLKVDLKLKPGDFNEKIKVLSNHEVVSYWIRDNDEKTEKFILNIELIDPEGKVLSTFNQVVDFVKGSKRMRSRIKSEGFSLTVSGTYLFNVSYKEDQSNKDIKVQSIPVEVVINREIK